MSISFPLVTRDGAKSEFMNFLYNVSTGQIIRGWQHETEAERDRMYNDILTVKGRPEDIVVRKGFMTDGQVHLTSKTPTVCNLCMRDGYHKPSCRRFVKK